MTTASHSQSYYGSRKTIIFIVLIYLSIFINSFVFFKQPFEFQFGYIVYIPLLPVFIRRYGFNRNLIIIYLILLVTGIANILLGNNTLALFFKVFLGLSMSYFFYYYVLLEFDLKIEQLFKWYLTGCYIVSIIGLIQFVSFLVDFTPGYSYRWILNKWGFSPGGMFGIRINSIFSEPTHLATVVSAGFFVAVYNVIRNETYLISRSKSIVIIVVYLLSFSGMGQLGIFLTLVFLAMNFGLIRYIFVVIPVLIFAFSYLYDNVTDFRERYDGLVGLFSGAKFELGKTHGSSFILYNNFHVAIENFKSNFIFGSGIGSHPVAFEKYSLAKGIAVYGFDFNSADANSMLLRLISETGLFGVSIFLFIIFKFYVAKDLGNTGNHWIISNGILIMILLNLIRQGHYFLNGFPFFLMLYIYNWYSYHGLLETGESEESSHNGAAGHTDLRIQEKS